MKTKYFELDGINSLRADWRTEAIEQGWTEGQLELLESSFDFVVSNQLIGDPLARDNKATFIGIEDDEATVVAIAEVIASSRGRERTVKIMRIEVAPRLAGADKSEYDKKYAKILAHLAASFFLLTRIVGSITKVYANDHADQEYLADLHSQLSKEDLSSLGLSVRFEGQRWLAFELIKSI